MSNPKISISVPVYNVERYLRQCLDSLLAQTMQDIQIVLVDDGSTDSSGSICDEYAAKDSRILLIHKENGGLASARQAALEAATGDYFCACDADDWVEPDMYEQLYNKAQETGADIVMCDYWSEYEEKKVERHYTQSLDEVHDIFDDALNGRFPSMVWNKLIRRNLFERFGLSWAPGINLGEDFLMTLKLLQHPINIVHIPACLYHYRRIIGGISYTNQIKMTTFRQSLAIRQWVESNCDQEKYAKGISTQWINLAFTGLRVEDGMSPQYYTNTIMPHLPYRGFIKYKQFSLKAILVLITKVWGYRAGRAIYHLGYRLIYK